MNADQQKQFINGDIYELLGVDESATIEQIKKAYRKRALELHPDKNLQNPIEAQKRFILLNKAMEVLRDEGCKTAYNEMYRQQNAANHRSQAEEIVFLNERIRRELRQQQADRFRFEEAENDFMNEQLRKELMNFKKKTKKICIISVIITVILTIVTLTFTIYSALKILLQN